MSVESGGMGICTGNESQCASCKSALGESYYLQNQTAKICQGCWYRLTTPSRLKGWEAFFRTILAGGLAAVICALINALFLAFEFQLAIVWIVLAVVIAQAIKAGSEDRGSWLYRLLAVAFTYAAIGLSLLFCVLFWLVVGFPKSDDSDKSKSSGVPFATMFQPGKPGAGTPTPGASSTPQALPRPSASGTPAPEDGPFKGMDDKTKGVVGILLLLTLPLMVVAAGPVFMAWASPVSGFIYVYAFYIAWKSSARDSRDLSGPFPALDAGPETDKQLMTESQEK